jgi:hypothetical protein
MIFSTENGAQDDSLSSVVLGHYCAGILRFFVVESQSALVSKVEGSTFVHRPPGAQRIVVSSRS